MIYTFRMQNIERKIQRAHVITTSIPEIIWSQEQRGIDSETKFECDECAAGCCIFPHINSLSKSEASLITQSPTVFRSSVISGFHKDRCQPTIPILLEEKPDEFSVQQFKRIHASKRSTAIRRGTVDAVDGCPALDNCGRCGIYDDRPETCRRFKPGSFDCQSLYVGRGSVAAREVEQALNDPQPAFFIIKRLCYDEVEPRQYDFSGL